MPSRTISAAEAIREATDICMARDPRVYLLGEGVADPKGIFGTTSGLLSKYGSERVVEMPVAENGLTGIAIGSALVGRRPLMIHQRVDFALLAMEQICNNAAKTHYVTNGRHRVPLVIRMIIGRGWGQGPEHSQSLEAVFAHFPGLKVVMPSLASDAKGMLIAAVEDDNPVIYLEHRWMHYTKGDVPEGYYTTPLDGPRRIRSGDDVTIVATSYMLNESLRAADAMADGSVQADVFDLRLLRPLNLQPIVDSVRRTGRLIVVDTGWKLYGIGAEIAAAVTEACFAALKAPPKRLGLPDHPTPSSRTLVVDFYPQAQTIVDTVCQLIPEAAERLQGVQQSLAALRSQQPIDVPDPAFHGPF